MIDYTDEERYKWMFCDVFIANGSQVRSKEQSHMMFWKNRRNAGIALKKRLRDGKLAKVLLDTQTMDVITDIEIARQEVKDTQIVRRVKRFRKKLPKAVRYAISSNV